MKIREKCGEKNVEKRYLIQTSVINGKTEKKWIITDDNGVKCKKT